MHADLPLVVSTDLTELISLADKIFLLLCRIDIFRYQCIRPPVKKIDDLFFGKDSFKKFTDHFNINQELTVIKNSNIAFDLDTSEDLDLLTLEQRNKLFKDNDN